MPHPRPKKILEQWLRELHFFPPLTLLHVPSTSSESRVSDASTTSPDTSVWRFYRNVNYILELARQSSRSTSILTNPSEPQPHPELDVLPTQAVEPRVVENLEDSRRRLSFGILSLPEDWKRSTIRLQAGRRRRTARDLLNREALLVYIQSGMEDIHFKWEAREYFDKLGDREANITVMEDRTTGGGYYNSQWWLLHAVSHSSIQRFTEEQEVDRFMALCIAGLFQMPDFMPPNVPQLNHPLSLAPIEPVSIMVQMQLVGWEKNLFPIGFVAQRRKPGASALLGDALQASLNMLILYFLSTRASLGETLPPWLFIYGMSYDDEGVLIFAHYPHLVKATSKSEALLGQIPQQYWGYVSVLVCDKHAKCFKNQKAPRFPLAHALLTIQAHTINLMNKLKQWVEYQDMKLLIQCARSLKRGAKI